MNYMAHSLQKKTLWPLHYSWPLIKTSCRAREKDTPVTPSLLPVVRGRRNHNVLTVITDPPLPPPLYVCRVSSPPNPCWWYLVAGTGIPSSPGRESITARRRAEEGKQRTTQTVRERSRQLRAPTVGLEARCRCVRGWLEMQIYEGAV